MKCRPFPLNQGGPDNLIPWLPFDKSGGIISYGVVGIDIEMVFRGQDLRIRVIYVDR